MPRLVTPIVLCDDCGGEAERAAEQIARFGYTRFEILDGGIAAGKGKAGYEIFSGVNVPSKAFGEFFEQEYETPRLPAAQVKAKIDAGEKVVILDSRPMVEFNNMSIPGGSCCPGAELVYRVSDAVEDPDTLVVVNCAGRTRSIIGCQSLINAGIPNPVVALKDGTMGWHLAGFALDHGQTLRHQRSVSPVSRVLRPWRPQSVSGLVSESSRCRNSAHSGMKRASIPCFYSTCALPRNLKWVICPVRYLRPAVSWCRPRTSTSVCATRAWSSSTTPACGP
ncbi:MAG: hypothetical protein Ct9H300mP16_00840 [Pseudomonadota bacterium]|nr:MAG: hypothetical protein Ct9H300mP16_00840 [Pseudomonadota bacterium]